MEVTYRREMKHNYLIIEQEEAGYDSYETHMLAVNGIEGLLKFHIKQVDSRKFYYYEITSKQPLSRILEYHSMGGEELRKLIGGIAQTLGRLEAYLLQERQIILEPEYIYVEPERFSVFLCLVPGRQGRFPEEMTGLLQYLLGKVNHQDKECVVMAYGLYQESLKENYGMDDLFEILGKASRGKETEAENEEMGYDEMRDKETESKRERNGEAGSRKAGRREDGKAGNREAGSKGSEKTESWEAEITGTGRTENWEAGSRGPGKAENRETGSRGPEKTGTRETGGRGSGNKGAGRREAESKAAGNKGTKNREIENPESENPHWLTGFLPTEDVPLFSSFHRFKEEAGETDSYDGESAKTQEFVPLIVRGAAASVLAIAGTAAVLWLVFGREGIWKFWYAAAIAGILAILAVFMGAGKEASALSEDIYKKEERWHQQEEIHDWQMVFDEEMEKKETKEEEETFQTVLLTEPAADNDIRYLRAAGPGAEDIAIAYVPYLIGKQNGLVDWVLDSDTISRIHARIDREGDEYRISDLNSTNGTCVNGRLLETNETAVLKKGDEVLIADFAFIFT